MKKEELCLILENHKKWLNNEYGGVRANLENANLRGANLENANLRGANLEDANLENANGNNKEIKSLQLGKYSTIILVGVKIHIGCQNHSIEEWENFTDEEISRMDKGALEWWKEWKEFILKVAKGDTK